MTNNITKTILSSLEDDRIETLVWYIRQADSKHEAFEHLKSHLLQSQIRLIELVKKDLEEMVRTFHETLCSYPIECSCCHNASLLKRELTDQISSLNETLEFLKKSL